MNPESFMQVQLVDQLAQQEREAQAAEGARLAALRKAADDEFAATAVARDQEAVQAHQGDKYKQRLAAQQTAHMLDGQV